jgi:hypothetical protein
MDPELFKNPYFWLAAAVGFAVGFPLGRFFIIQLYG